MTSSFSDILNKMVEVRRHLHRFPELSNNEINTQRLLEQELRGAGLQSIREVGGFGLSVDICGQAGACERIVAIRADIDALPIAEASGEEFSSENPGVMHACGHDAHAAMGVAAAMTIHRRRADFSGTVRIIFQPAEEAEPLGGRRVVEGGLLDDVSYVLGIHVDPYIPTGNIAVREGQYTLASDIFTLQVKGRAAHAATPSQGIDAIAVACTIVSELQKVATCESDAYEPLVVSVTEIAGGNGFNVIADTVVVKGTFRSGFERTRSRAAARVRSIAEGVAAIFGASVDIEIIRGEPPVYNDPVVTRHLRQTALRYLNEAAVLDLPGWAAADDFGFYSERRPSVYFRLGIRNEAKRIVQPLHHPGFRVDEEAMPLGVSILTDTALSLLSG